MANGNCFAGAGKFLMVMPADDQYEEDEGYDNGVEWSVNPWKGVQMRYYLTLELCSDQLLML